MTLEPGTEITLDAMGRQPFLVDEVLAGGMGVVAKLVRAESVGLPATAIRIATVKASVNCTPAEKAKLRRAPPAWLSPRPLLGRADVDLGDTC